MFLREGEFISASVVTYNDGEEAAKACRSLIAYTKKYPLKLYVADNSGTDETAKILGGIDGVELIRMGRNAGFGAGHNAVLSKPLGKYHFIINPDIEINSDVLSDMTDEFEDNPDIVLAMPKICNPDGSEQKLPKERPTAKRLFLGRLAFLGGAFAKIRREYTWADKDINETADVNFCSGCFCGIKTQVFKELGGFDERFFMYLEDSDLTLRAKQFGRTVMMPKTSVTHFWHRESSKSLKYLFVHFSSSIKFLIKWRNVPQ